MDLHSGHAYWLVKNGLLGVYPPLREDATCDVAIIGAGITGALIAQRMTSAGVNVILLDKRDVGEGSTAASTSLLQYEIDTELVELKDRIGEQDAVRCYQLGLEAIDEFERLVQCLDDDCGFTRRPSVYLASDAKSVERLRREFELRKEHGFEVEFLESSDIADAFPFTAPAAIRSRGDAEVDALRLTHALIRSAMARGLRVFDRTDVKHIESSDSGCWVETDRGASVHAMKVMYATGYESQKYLRQKVGNLNSTFAAVSEPLDPFPQWPDRCLIWESARPYFYLRTSDDGRAIIGGEDTPYSNDHDRDGLIEKKTRKLVQRFEEMFPGTRFEVAYAWAGTFGETKDGLAYIGSPAERPDAYFALGYGGNGITMSMIAARIITDLYLGRPNSDVRLFRFDR